MGRPAIVKGHRVNKLADYKHNWACFVCEAYFGSDDKYQLECINCGSIQIKNMNLL